MSDAISRYESSGIAQLDIASELPAIFRLATALSQAGGFLPASIKSEGELVAVILAGRELGLPPMVSLRSLNLIKGKVTIDASMQLALMVSRAGCKIQWVKDGSDGETATLRLERPGQPPHESTFTVAMATKAGLMSNDNWKKHTAAMLRARCVSAAGRAYCPDVLAGCYVPGEIEEEREPRPALRVETRAAAAPVVEYSLTGPGVPTAVVHKPIDYVGAAAAEQKACDTGEPTRDEQVRALLEVDLPQCTTVEHFAALASELVSLHGRIRKSEPWERFAAACAEHEVQPRAAIELAQKGAA